MPDIGPRPDDVLVVGGGPAGVAAATALTDRGASCHVIEAGPRGRDKACGDAFVSRTLPELNTIGLSLRDLAAVGRPFGRIDLTFEGRRIWSLEGSDWGGWMLPRRTIDQALRNQVAVRAPVHYGVRLVAVHFDTDKPLAVVRRTPRSSDVPTDDQEERWSVAAVILATGATSMIARSFGIDGRPASSASLTAYRCDHAEAPCFDFSHRDVPGYVWRFPSTKGIANVGVCQLGTISGTRLRDAMRSIAGTRESGAAKWRGGVGPLWSGRGVRWHDDRGVVSCGDAAGLVDPINGEGLSAALSSGRWAGEAIASYLRNDRNWATLARYSTELKGRFTDRYRPTPTRSAWTRLAQSSPAP